MLNKFSDTRNFAENGYDFIRKWFLLNPWGNVLFGEKLHIDAKNSNFKNFESTLYMKSGSMPLRTSFTRQIMNYLLQKIFFTRKAGP